MRSSPVISIAKGLNGVHRWWATGGICLGVLLLAVAFLSTGDRAKAVPARPDDKAQRDYLWIVGSSTVYPHAIKVAKAFVENTGAPAPAIERTGSGGGLKKFCAGIGLKYPDISNASRAMKRKEWKLCRKNNVGPVTEIRFGNDGLVLVESIKDKVFNLSIRQVYLATSKWVPKDGKLIKNPYRNWREIDPSLPDRTIQIYGYGPKHGAYTILRKNVFYKVCKNLEYFKTRRSRMGSNVKFKDFLKKKCSKVRDDGIYIPADQNAEQVINIINASPMAMALLGYSNVFPNRDRLQSVAINGVEPHVYTISDGTYALSRPLFFYIKNRHRTLLPAVSQYIREFMSNAAMGTFGYLAGGGLGTLGVEDLKSARYAAAIGRKMRRFRESDLQLAADNMVKPEGAQSAVQENSLKVVAWGGANQEAFKGAFFDLFTKENGVVVTEDSWNGEMAKIRYMNETGRVTWDVVQVEEPETLQGCDEGLFEKIDWGRIQGGKKALIEGGALECGVGVFVWTTLFTYDGDKIKEGPKNWADFWNVEKWPGKRGLRHGAKMTLEMALLADGVAREDVYKLLKTNEGVDRAFKKLDELKPHIAWWRASTDPQEWLASGKVAMTAAYSARVLNAVEQKKKNFKLVWDGHNYSIDYWTIVKGSAKIDEAYKFLNMYLRPERQKIYFNKISNGWTARGTGRLVNPDRIANMPTARNHFERGLLTNAEFWLDNGVVLNKRFKQWVSK